MLSPMSASEILDREFLDVRAKILELGACLDRWNRAEGSVADDKRIHKVREALEVLLGDAPEKAEQIQMLFSLPYDDEWQEKFNVRSRS